MTHITKWTKKYYLGTVDKERIYLSAPKWDCGWYWGFGYLGNNNCHYHLRGINDGKNQNMYDALLEHFKEQFIFDADIKQNVFGTGAKLWTFCELAQTAYTLKETAECLGRGGSHYTTNPCADIIKNADETKRINEVVLPAIFDAMASLLETVTAQHESAPADKSLTSAAI